VRIILLCLIASIAAAQTPRSKGPVVLLHGRGDVSVSSGSVAVPFAAESNTTVSKNDPTIEMAQQLLKRCPEVTLVVKDSNVSPDYELVLDRTDGRAFSDGSSEIMLLRATDKTVLYADKKSSIGKAVNGGCKAILADWKLQHSGATEGPWQIQKSEASK
jgi:hypothetical protein